MDSLPPRLLSLLQLSSEEVLALAEKSLEIRRDTERAVFYEPNKPVEDLVRSIGTTSHLVYVLSAANGIGKTTALVNVAANLIFGPQNRFFDYPLFKTWPYPKRIRIVSDPSQVKDSAPIPSEIQKWWPRGRYEPFKDGQHYFSQYKSGDWILEVMTYEQAPKEHEGANLGLVLFNEPPPEKLWVPNISRLRAGGIAVVGMTPLNEAGWFFDKVAPRYPETIFYADVEAGCKEHGTRGHLKHDDIEKMIAEYSPEEREARVGGKAMYLQGRVFKTFTPNVHVLKEPVRAPLHSTLYNVVDPHTNKPFFAIWAWPCKNGDLIIVDEHPNEDFFKMHNCQWTIEDYKRMYSSKEHGYEVKRIIDHHFADVRSAATKKTLKEDLESIGLSYESSYTATEEIDTGVLKVREYLRYDASRPVDTVNRPKIFVNPHCLNTIKSFQYWAIDPKTGKYKDDYKDPMDCVRYLVMANPQASEPLPPQQFRKLYG